MSNLSSGTGYVVIPSDVDRDVYIEYCFRKERISIQPELGGDVLQNCYITKSAIKEISFPDNKNELGSPVVYVYHPQTYQPIVVGIISRVGDGQGLHENVYKKSIKSKDGIVSVEMKPKGGIFIDVDSNFENNSNIYITLRSKNNNAKFNLKCFGDINIYSEGETSLETLKSFRFITTEVNNKVKSVRSSISMDNDGFVYEDKFGNKVEAKTDGTIVLHNGESPSLKGDELVNELNKLKSKMNAFIDTYLDTITSVGGGGAAAKIAMEAALSGLTDADFSEVKSEKFFIK